MGFENMKFDPLEGLRNSSKYKATPVSEDDARDQVQGRLDEIRDYINDKLVAALNANTGSSGADNIGSTAISGLADDDGVNEVTVRGQISKLKQQMDSNVAELRTEIVGAGTGHVNIVSQIGGGDITGTMIHEGAIGTDHIAGGAVTIEKLDSVVLSSLSVADGSLTNEKLMLAGATIGETTYGGITGDKLADGAISQLKLADSAVSRAKLENGIISADDEGRAKIANLAITDIKLASNAVTEAKIASGAVTTTKIKDANVTLAKLESSIQTKLATERTRKITISSGNPGGGSSGDIWLKY